MPPVIGVVDWPVLASQVDGLRASWDLGLRSIVRLRVRWQSSTWVALHYRLRGVYFDAKNSSQTDVFVALWRSAQITATLLDFESTISWTTES
jgi:hypothetical protein